MSDHGWLQLISVLEGLQSPRTVLRIRSLHQSFFGGVMIDYTIGRFGVGLMFRCKGSIIPKALIWAVPNGLVALILHFMSNKSRGITWFQSDLLSVEGSFEIWAGYTFILGFLIVFRNNQAYNRLWEGANGINGIRADWYDAISNCMAFCDPAPDAEKASQVEAFQYLLAKLSSMLFCSALQQVCEFGDEKMEVLSADGIGSDELIFLADAEDRVELLMHWIQRHITQGVRSGVLVAPPPIVSRVYQELSSGIASLSKVKNIKAIPFPFPYAQILVLMLLVHWVVTPWIASQEMDSPMYACLLCFCVTLANWSLLYIALEIDQPFGEDPNDLPVQRYMTQFNRSLTALLEPLAQRVPVYRHIPQSKLIIEQATEFNQQVGPSGRTFQGNGCASKTVDNDLDEDDDNDVAHLLSIQSAVSFADCFGELASQKRKPKPPPVGETKSLPGADSIDDVVYRRGHGSIRLSGTQPIHPEFWPEGMVILEHPQLNGEGEGGEASVQGLADIRLGAMHPAGSQADAGKSSQGPDRKPSLPAATSDKIEADLTCSTSPTLLVQGSAAVTDDRDAKPLSVLV